VQVRVILGAIATINVFDYQMAMGQLGTITGPLSRVLVGSGTSGKPFIGELSQLTIKKGDSSSMTFKEELIGSYPLDGVGFEKITVGPISYYRVPDVGPLKKDGAVATLPATVQYQ